MSNTSIARQPSATSKGYALPPGPKGYPLIGIVPKMRKDPVQFFSDMARQYGDIVYWTMAQYKTYFINHPEAIKQVLVTKIDNYPKSRLWKHFKPIIGDGLVMQEGEAWRQRRKLVESALTHKRIEELFPIMVKQIDEMMEGWDRHVREQQPLDISQEMTYVTLKVAASTMLSSNITDYIPVVMKSITTILHAVERRMYGGYSLPYSVPTPNTVKLKKAMEELDGTIKQCIEEHKRNPDAYNDLLSMYITAKDEENGRVMTDKELAGESRTTLIAGHETTATMLTWAFYLLAQHPEIRQRLYEEIDTVLEGRTPTFADLMNLKYTRMVMLETLRLYPSAWLVSRSPIEDDELLGYHVPKGSIVCISSYTLHRREEDWPEPEKFDPERFTPQASRSRLSHGYLAFGGGSHNCVGSGFAMVEGALILAAVIQRYKFELVPGQQIGKRAMITLRPNKSIWMNMSHV